MKVTPSSRQNHVSKIPLHNSLSPSLIISSQSVRGRSAHMTERAIQGPHWRNVQVSSRAIGLLWEFPTSFSFHASLRQEACIEATSISYLPSLCKTTTQTKLDTHRRRCGCLMTGSAALSIFIIIITAIIIAAGSHGHLHSPPHS